jgi:hypothetical protein
VVFFELVLMAGDEIRRDGIWSDRSVLRGGTHGGRGIWIYMWGGMDGVRKLRERAVMAEADFGVDEQKEEAGWSER